jgi:hypothetical protein
MVAVDLEDRFDGTAYQRSELGELSILQGGTIDMLFDIDAR